MLGEFFKKIYSENRKESIIIEGGCLMIHILVVIIGVVCWFWGRAYETKHKIKDTPLTTFKANPRSFYPSIYFGLNSKGIEEVERLVEAETVITRENGKTSIAKSVDKLVELYSEAIEIEKIKWLKEKISLCHKAIKLERENFLTDNGPAAAEFTMNRQNVLTNYILTGITIPMLIGAINVEASSIDEFVQAVAVKPILLLTFEVFLVVFSYRVYKYHWNKRSKLNDTKRVILYNKAELMLCAFETAVDSKNLS